MLELLEGPNYTTMDEKIHSGDYIKVEFELESINPFKFKFLGILDEDNELILSAPDQQFYPISIGEVITLVDGKFPLQDYMDTLYKAGHKYIFEKDNGIILEGILDGFTHNCTYIHTNEAESRLISVYLKKNK